ncbi:MAG: acyl--CoA ligase [Oscillospiraceae bacterium]|nr:acyl--CoA ligase [Oscillospiraceae bacterium]
MQEPLNRNCYEYFVECSGQYGEYDAVEFLGKKHAKSRFLHDIDGLAAYMQKEVGLKRGDVYTVFLPTTIQSYVAFYALNKIGAIINFIHPLSPPEALGEAMAASGSKGVMILDMLSKKYIDAINRQGVPCLVCRSSDYAPAIRGAGINIAEQGFRLVFPSIKKRSLYRLAVDKYPPQDGVNDNGNEIAFYLNGGGTTGKSKTIKLTSKAVNELVYKVLKLDGIHEPGVECGICVLPMFHAYGLTIGMHLITCVAGRVIPMMNFNEKRFNKIMRKNKTVFIVGIPAMFKKIMAEKNFDGAHLGNLRYLFCGGDDVSQAFLDKFNTYLEKHGAPGRLRQGYGLTEVSSVCCANIQDVYRPGSIGKPLEDVTMEIWDDNRKPVPNGTVGEIAVSGNTIMEGYFSQGKPADEGLYTDKNGVKWVLSGDLGYRDDDGYFFFSGRKKRMMIISGYNVYPTDVENLVDGLPFMREVCAIQAKDGSGKPFLRLFVSFRDRGLEEEHKKEIIRLCENNLMRFSVPKEIVVMDELPRTAMKKVDFMKLADLRVGD